MSRCVSRNEAVDVYMTAKGGREQAAAVRDSRARLGVESANPWPFDDTAEFVDYPFTDPDATYTDHLDTVCEHQPALTVAPDVEKGTTLAEAVDMADRLAEYADNVILVPKECHPTKIPDRHRVGLTVGSFGSMAPWGLWEYRNAGPVHILGGSPNEQLAVGMHGIDVASVDSFTLGIRARYGVWENGKCNDDAHDMNYRERLTTSLNSYVQAWAEIRTETEDGTNVNK